ncbi:MAG: pentapeptide repeat-containing protein [Bacteroidota bacterium]|nr:pentapeptide repeat-containing protein [Bacteroidota bacterium]
MKRACLETQTPMSQAFMSVPYDQFNTIYFYLRMKTALHENKTFDNIDWSEKEVSKNEFLKCIFKDCNFSNGLLLNNEFADCQFVDCNLSMIKLDATALRNVSFKNCKLIGVDFSNCKDFLFCVSFENCILDYVYFFKKKLRDTIFKRCSIREANFADTDLTNAVFADCDLSMTQFEKSNLNGADFTSAYNYTIDPELNRMKNAKFSVNGLAGLLCKYEIIVE